LACEAVAAPAPESSIKQSAAVPETIGTIGTSATVGTGFVQIVMKPLHRYSEPKVSVVYRVSRRLERFERLELFERATLIAERFGGLDEDVGER
jgi:hypothetical protein